MIRLLLCTLILAIAMPALAGGIDSAQTRILIIPFNPDYFFSDADRDIAKVNGISEEEVRKQFHEGIHLKLSARVLSLRGYPSAEAPLYTDPVEVDEAMMALYRNLHYRQSKPVVPLLDEATISEVQKPLGDRLKLKLQEKLNPPTPESGIDLGLHPGMPENSYMHADLHNASVLGTLSERYNTAYFLFINQVELLTHFEHCLDRTTDNFHRSAKVHFTVYDASGRVVYGNAITMTSETRAMNPQDIIEQNFGPIATFIADQLP